MLARDQLDRIGLAIRDGTFRFKTVFPKDKKGDSFAELERQHSGRSFEPNELTIGEFMEKWFELISAPGRRTERTLLGYKSLLWHYIWPFFKDRTFAELNLAVLDDFAICSKKLKLREKEASKTTINKAFILLKMMCKDAAIRYQWGAAFNPFCGFKRLP